MLFACVMLRCCHVSQEFDLSKANVASKNSQRSPWSLRCLLTIFAILLFFLISVWVGFLWWQQPVHRDSLLRISRLKVISDAKHITSREVAQHISDNIQGGFFSVNLTALRSVLLENPWLAQVTFRRQWPHTLVVKVIEQKPLAVWQSKALFNTDGHLYSPPFDSFPVNLPRLSGADAAAQQILQQYRHFKQLLLPLGLSITDLKLSNYDNWELVIDNNMTVVLGHEDVEQRMQKFILLYNKVIASSKQAALRVDLRYPNGAAVDWNDR